MRMSYLLTFWTPAAELKSHYSCGKCGSNNYDSIYEEYNDFLDDKSNHVLSSRLLVLQRIICLPTPAHLGLSAGGMR